MIEKNAIEASREWFETWIKITRRLSEQQGPPDHRRLFTTISDPTHSTSSTPTHSASMPQPSTAGPERDSLSKSSSPPSISSISPRISTLVPSVVADGHHQPWWYSSGLLLVVLLLFCTTVLFYYQASSASSEIAALRLRAEQNASKYTFLRAAAALTAGRDPPANEALLDHWNFFKMRGEIDRKLASWSARVHEIESAITLLANDMHQFSLPRPTDESDFYNDFEKLLAISSRIGDAKLLEMLTRSIKQSSTYEDDQAQIE
jgi:hypothetical protein